ncbi:MAG: helix-turn-helix domain-containing protein [Coleofasciculus sp. C1-SOL-03]
MLLGFKTELKLNNKQRTALAKHCGVSRHAWNCAIRLTETKNLLKMPYRQRGDAFIRASFPV